METPAKSTNNEISIVSDNATTVFILDGTTIPAKTSIPRKMRKGFRLSEIVPETDHQKVPKLDLSRRPEIN